MSDKRPDTIDEASAKKALEDFRAIQAMTVTTGWGIFKAWLNRWVEQHKNDLCVEKLTEVQTAMLRGRVQVLRSLIQATAVDSNMIVEMEKQLRGLQAREDAMHDLRATTRSSS